MLVPKLQREGEGEMIEMMTKVTPPPVQMVFQAFLKYWTKSSGMRTVYRMFDDPAKMLFRVEGYDKRSRTLHTFTVPYELQAEWSPKFYDQFLLLVETLIKGGHYRISEDKEKI